MALSSRKTPEKPPKPPGPIKRIIASDSFQKFRVSTLANVLMCLVIPLITLCTLEWIARGSTGASKQDDPLYKSMQGNLFSFVIAYLLFVLIYVFISQLTGLHVLATICIGLLGNVPASVTYYKLSMRGEPFLPWDLIQIDDFMSIKGKVNIIISPSMVVTLLLFILLALFASLIKVPPAQKGKNNLRLRMISTGTAFMLILILLFGVFLNREATTAIGIKDDAWLQDRYYRSNGVITGFLTNMQGMEIVEPENYTAKSIQQIYNSIGQGDERALPAAVRTQSAPKNPDIIYVMGESFWDVTSLPNVTYDTEIFPNLSKLKLHAATGHAYSPSFGGGTCDVEFEALTGFSMEHLPAGCKPYQQYINNETFALPVYLKTKGYDTLAIHGFGREFWNRNIAYPLIGIDTFIAQDDMPDVKLRRGFISDDAIVDRIIYEHETRSTDNPEASVFIHAVTMQNHGTYGRERYPEDELVRVTSAPASIPDNTIGQLEDCATSMHEMDAAIGKLTAYLEKSDRPTILVFWGDHLNPLSDGYRLYEETGFIEPGDISSPHLYETPLLIWSNYSTIPIDIGTIATYNISPAMMEMYNLDMPPMFRFLADQLRVTRARTRGLTVTPNGGYTRLLNAEQRKYYQEHALMQYDLLFGNRYLDDVSEGTS